MGRALPSSVDKLGIKSVFLNDTYVYNMDVSPPVTSALEVALVTFAKNPKIRLISVTWNPVKKQRGTGLLLLGPGCTKSVHAVRGQSVNQWTEKPCLQAVVT